MKTIIINKQEEFEQYKNRKVLNYNVEIKCEIQTGRCRTDEFTY